MCSGQIGRPSSSSIACALAASRTQEAGRVEPGLLLVVGEDTMVMRRKVWTHCASDYEPSCTHAARFFSNVIQGMRGSTTAGGLEPQDKHDSLLLVLPSIEFNILRAEQPMSLLIGQRRNGLDAGILAAPVMKVRHGRMRHSPRRGRY